MLIPMFIEHRETFRAIFLFIAGVSLLLLMQIAGQLCAWLIAAALLGLGDGFAVFAGAPRLVQSTRIRGSALWPCAMGMEISALRTADLLPAAQLLLDAFTERDDDKVNALSRPLIFAEHILGLSQRRHQNVLLACRVDQDVIGLVEMYTPEFLASQIPDVPPQYSIKMLRPYIANLAVKSAARKQGVASALIQRCEEKAREAGQDKITLQVFDFNGPALALYKSLGYQVVGSKQDQRLVGDIFFGRSVPATKLSLEKAL